MMQQKYIELLEKRIAQLEVAVNSTIESPTLGSSQSEQNEEKDSTKEAGSVRYRNILRKFDKTTGSHTDSVVGANFFLEEKKAKDVAYTFRRVYDPDKGAERAYSELDIEDPALIQVLKSVIGKYPGVNFDGDIISMLYPFAPLVHKWDDLGKYVSDNPDSQQTKDLTSLLDRTKTAPELQSYFKIRDANLSSQVVTFDTLWTIFAPGTLVVARIFQNITQIFKVEESPIPWDRRLMLYNIMLVWSWDWDGKKMVKVQYELHFERFRGTKQIQELPYYPLSYHKDEQDLLEKVRKRTVNFIKSTARCKEGAGQMFRYNGLAYADQRNILAKHDEQHNPDEDGANKRPSQDDEEAQQPKLVSIKSDILVDSDAFIQNGSGNLPLGGELYTSDEIHIDELQTNSEEYLEFAELVKKVDLEAELDHENVNFLIFPPRVLGYATREKVWGQFNLDLMKQPVGKQASKFDDDLQLDPKYKTLIKALVESHEQSSSHSGHQVEDVVQDKGKGLVLLLHGPPGVGKTLTAETIAQATAKPLVVVGVAEIGLDASRAERNLERLFHLATKWEAILLVDEADVFLETRGSTSDASRNALVSVLLRVLEYYQGIVILTTNRITSIDVAVISRIHLAIQYKDLTLDVMRSIFKFFLDQCDPDSISGRDAIDDYIDSFGHHHRLNGRQIRNVVSAALASAKHEALSRVDGKPIGDGRMTYKHIREVCSMTRDFQEQLKDYTRSQRSLNEAKSL